MRAGTVDGARLAQGSPSLRSQSRPQPGVGLPSPARRTVDPTGLKPPGPFGDDPQDYPDPYSYQSKRNRLWIDKENCGWTVEGYKEWNCTCRCTITVTTKHYCLTSGGLFSIWKHCQTDSIVTWTTDLGKKPTPTSCEGACRTHAATTFANTGGTSPASGESNMYLVRTYDVDHDCPENK